jgi:hypothetical protein
LFLRLEKTGRKRFDFSHYSAKIWLSGNIILADSGQVIFLDHLHKSPGAGNDGLSWLVAGAGGLTKEYFEWTVVVWEAT